LLWPWESLSSPPATSYPTEFNEQENQFALQRCYGEVLPEMSEAQFRKSDYMEQLSASVQFSREEQNKGVKETYDIG
jgi:hypothetical protein